MTIKFQVGGVSTVIPGVYSDFTVNPSLLAPAAPARDMFIFGEAVEGVPTAEMDLRGNFYTDFKSVQDFYRSGPIVDAARMAFSKQPSQIFGGSVNRLYVYKTNNSTRATKTVSAPSGYGTLFAARYGERGNQIKTQIKTGQAEVKPTKTLLYLPSPASRTFRVAVDGAVTGALAVSGNGLASDFVTALGAVSGLSATGGAVHTSVTSGPLTADLSAPGGDVLVLTRASGSATWGATVAAGDVAYIPAGTPVAGTDDVNAGSYLVVSVTTTVLTLKKLKSVDGSGEVNTTDFDAASGVSVGLTDVLINAPVVLSVSATTTTGSGATLELLEDTADKLGAGMMVVDSSLVALLGNSTSSVANISATVPATGKLTVSLSSGSWLQTPKAGDLVRIPLESLLAGATNKNVGLLVVESATSQTVTCSHLFSGLTTEAVAEVALNGDNAALKLAPGFVSTSLAAKRIDSAAERKVQLFASRASDGASLPTDLIGGNVALELGYYEATATDCVVSINSHRVMTVTPTGSGLSTITVNTKKYATLQELVDFLNTQANLYAKIPDARQKTSSPALLDMVSEVGILDGQALPAYNGRLKTDYSAWKQFFEDNFGLLAFQDGGMTLKAGLPDAESVAGFLSGAAVGGTSNASVQAALDAALKVQARVKVPLFSRDAVKDIDDGLTDTSSNYTIESINAATKAHVATASGADWGNECYGEVSFSGSFADALQHCAELGYERQQFPFQRVKATGADGTLKTFLPWMAATAIAAGRCQAVLGTSMLRKPLLLSDVTHPGDTSLYTDSLVGDFDPNDRGQLSTAIQAGLTVLRAVPGFGVRMESADQSTRSRDNDPTSWVYERINVLFTCDEVIQTVRSTLENFIGNRTSDTPTAVVKTAIEQVLDAFIKNGSLLSAQVTDIKSLGNVYQVTLKITPTEALEAITLNVTAERAS